MLPEEEGILCPVCLQIEAATSTLSWVSRLLACPAKTNLTSAFGIKVFLGQEGIQS